jgi:hypothetical protein
MVATAWSTPDCDWARTLLATRAVLTVPEAGAILRLGRSASYEAARRNEIPVLRLGRRLVVPVPLFLAMLGALGNLDTGVPQPELHV